MANLDWPKIGIWLGLAAYVACFWITLLLLVGLLP